MNVGDLVTVIVGFATIYFAWQQNRIFRQQNEIFLRQEGKEEMAIGHDSRLRRYWPMLGMALLMLMTWVGIGYNVYYRHLSSDNAPNEQLETVEGKVFANEEVAVDGQQFIDCTFTNVSYRLEGTGAFSMLHCTFIGSKYMRSHNQQIRLAWTLAYALGYINVPIVDPETGKPSGTMHPPTPVGKP